MDNKNNKYCTASRGSKSSKCNPLKAHNLVRMIMNVVVVKAENRDMTMFQFQAVTVLYAVLDPFLYLRNMTLKTWLAHSRLILDILKEDIYLIKTPVLFQVVRLDTVTPNNLTPPTLNQI
jgi:hypothetical protein